MNSHATRVRVKICGLTRRDDVDAAVGEGADALGFNCYDQSPRFVPLVRLETLVARLPPYVTPVLLFVNAPPAAIHAALAVVPDALLQFHGDENEADCARYGRPYTRALGIADGVALLDCERAFASASALLADTPTVAYGGSGQRFDWTRLPSASQRSKPLILAGGLNADNVGEAILTVAPYAVDVSSGVEISKGVKDRARIARFIAAVRAAESRMEQAT